MGVAFIVVNGWPLNESAPCMAVAFIAFNGRPYK
jgi:hypothetical protein